MISEDFNRPYRKYAPQAVQEQVLTHRLRLAGDEETQALLSELINRTAQSPFAKSVLEKAGEEGYEVCLGDLGNAKGCCRARSKQIVLSDKQPPDMWVSTLVHECRHAGQIARGATAGYSPFLSMASQLKEKRLMEADACAASARACNELMQQGDYMPSVLMRRAPSHASIADAYENSLAQGTDKAMTAAVLAWYDNELYKMAYETDHVMSPLSRGKAFRNPSGEFEEQPLADSIKTVCRKENGGTYFSEPQSVLDGARYAGISSVTAKWLESHAAECRALGGDVDPSVWNIPVYQSSDFAKTVLEEKYGRLPAPLSESARKILEEKRLCGEKVFDRTPKTVAKRPQAAAFWQQMKFER